MDPVGLDIDVELEELETRLERLRSLYEQYFLGIEKIEPAIARKDVDRRIWMLRREKIRNTGRRYKFQVLIQRYNTFQQYWQRICREIENGTYKRHMLRAEKILGRQQALTIAAKRRRGEYARRNEPEAPSEPELDAGKPTVAAPAPKANAQPAQPTKPARPKLVLERLELDIDDLVTSGKKPISSRPPAGLPKPAPPLASKPNASASASAPTITPKPVVAVTDREFGRATCTPVTSTPPAPARKKPPPLPTKRPPTPAGGPDVAKAPTTSAGVSDQRMRELHARLVDAKKQLNDPRGVTLDGLTKQLRQAEDSLRKQHGNRKIDFDVVVKDGKAVVKPILK